MRNIDSKIRTSRFDCFKFLFHSVRSATFATISAPCDGGQNLRFVVGFGEVRSSARRRRQQVSPRLTLTGLFPGQPLLPADLILLLKPYPAPVEVQQH